MNPIRTCVFLLIGTKIISCQKDFGPGKQDHGYVEVRPRAHMFFWLFHTSADVIDSSERPLILWLQGGPGGSSTGIGNFEIIGPLDANLNPRPHTWVNEFNVLFVDNPVGTGFSYVDDLSLLTTNNTQVAQDLVQFLRSFLERLPKFRNSPLYIFGQSYGGKMAVDFALMLHEEINSREKWCHLSGVALGDAWISPIEATKSWPDYLYSMSLIDREGHAAVKFQAELTERLFDSGQYAEATLQWSKTQYEVLERTDGVDFYNILIKQSKGPQICHTTLERSFKLATEPRTTSARDLLDLMNGPVAQALGIPSSVYWGSQSFDVFFALEDDFMKPVISVVEKLLNETTLKVYAYNGNLDLVCDTPGQMTWIDRLEWSKAHEFHGASRTTIWVNETMEGYTKTGGGFSFYWINAAGHSAPADNPEGIWDMLKSLTGI